MRTQTNALPSAADANRVGAAATVRSIPLQNNAADDVDGADETAHPNLRRKKGHRWRARL